MKKEYWKPVVGFEGLYEVSNFGRVKSLHRYGGIEERILKPQKDQKGYLRVRLYKDGVVGTFKVHRLVASAFLPNPHNLTEVNHINEVKTDNRSENLCWMSTKENSNYGTRNDRIRKAKTNGKTSKAVLQYALDGTFIKEFPSTNEIERQLGFAHGAISNCCKGHPHYSHAYGFIWRYKNKE